MTGAPHLRYGFARDFLLPALLTGVVGVALVSVGLWALLAGRRRRRLSPEFAFGVFAFLGTACLVVAFAYARADGIPRIESRHLREVVYTASCTDAGCDVQLRATGNDGMRVSIPQASTLTFGCASDRAAFTIFVNRLADGVPLSQACSQPRLVAAWPTVMGLPPGSFELAAVKVRNG
jgi:hypothetical protein